MSEPDLNSPSSESPAAGGPSVAPSLDGLLRLLDSSQKSDARLSAELAPFIRDLLAQVAADDPIERMLAVQIVTTFNRAMYLSRHANTQKNGTWFSLFSRECDRAMNLCRRQLQALSEHRRPPSPRRTTFTAIHHANIAGQQVITTAGPFAPQPFIPQPFQPPPPQPPPPRRRGRPPKVRPPALPAAPAQVLPPALTPSPPPAVNAPGLVVEALDDL
jgi:hypothetical protein